MKRPMILLFTADWCKPCQSMKPIIKEVAEELPIDYEFIDVTSEDPRIEKYLVRSTPTIVIEDGGLMKARFVGFQTADILKAAVISPDWN